MDIQWLEANRERLEPLIAMWNAAPYPTNAAVAATCKLSHERIRQLLDRARQIGLPVLTPEEQLQARVAYREKLRAEQKAQGEASLPHCGACGRRMSLRARPSSNGSYYCTKCRYRHDPEYRARHKALNYANHKRRLQTDPAYRAKLVGYGRAYRQRKALDPTYRLKLNAQNRKRYHRKRQQQLPG